MAPEGNIRALRRDDDRSHFCCDQDDLDRFFRFYAGQNQFKHGLSVTYVAEVDGRLAGFASVSAGHLERESLPDARLRRRLPSYPLPVIRIARLGVDVACQNRGIASALLRHVFRLALLQREATGCVGVVVDAKAEAVAFYEALGFVAMEEVREGLMTGDPKPMFLALETIAQAGAKGVKAGKKKRGSA